MLTIEPMRRLLSETAVNSHSGLSNGTLRLVSVAIPLDSIAGRGAHFEYSRRCVSTTGLNAPVDMSHVQGGHSV